MRGRFFSLLLLSLASIAFTPSFQNNFYSICPLSCIHQVSLIRFIIPPSFTFFIARQFTNVLHFPVFVQLFPISTIMLSSNSVLLDPETTISCTCVIGASCLPAPLYFTQPSNFDLSKIFAPCAAAVNSKIWSIIFYLSELSLPITLNFKYISCTDICVCSHSPDRHCLFIISNIGLWVF